MNTKTANLTILGAVAVVVCSTVLGALHDPIPQWMPYLAVFLFGHGVGSSVATAALAPLGASLSSLSSLLGLGSPPAPTAAPSPPAAPVAAQPAPAAVPVSTAVPPPAAA